MKVYPRVCGGTTNSNITAVRYAGLSPRVRGNPPQGRGAGAAGGSIPACAGEPPTRAGAPTASRVYPRVCGGTEVALPYLPIPGGLSPRVRGNQRHALGRRRAVRSIPACAGEPLARGRRPRHARVYPRVCGGTWARYLSFPSSCGLSPRVRGNRVLVPESRLSPGSIPACAGEPIGQSGTVSIHSVYPRVCGGTSSSGPPLPPLNGLSPRVRGNPGEWPIGRGFIGSIPACAGEPSFSSQYLATGTVYPRVCGGTGLSPRRRPIGLGLSPRVRGNPLPPARRWGSAGSIPACAGEPPRNPSVTDRQSVYPRVCGGTQPHGPRRECLRGLSPRVRGNPYRASQPMGRLRSIPACAGEPEPRRKFRSL